MTDWERIRDRGFAVPDTDAQPLADELLGMLASPDPRVRDEIALPILATWIERGTFDEILADLGDDLCDMLRGDAVFGRSFAALGLAACVDRGAAIGQLDAEPIRAWAHRVTAWLRGEDDARGYVDGSGWAHAFAHGADAIAAFAHAVPSTELAWLLDETVAIVRRDPAWWHGEPDRWARAIRGILARGALSADAWRTWIGEMARPSGEANPYARAANADAVLRALRLQLALGDDADAVGLGVLLDEALSDSLAPYFDRG